MQRPTVEVIGHKAHGPVPQPGSIVIARVTKVMARSASADIMCVGPKSVREKFTGIIRQNLTTENIVGERTTMTDAASDSRNDAVVKATNKLKVVGDFISSVPGIKMGELSLGVS
ncbi:hypothetical protein GmHk_04G010164 [Glycine max]|nr:hypothetical protein GmHk_04G010164 [Glycine max]